MAVNWRRLLTWIIGLLVLAALVLFVKQVFFASPSPGELILNTIALRNTNDTVQRAGLIADMDGMVQALENDGIAAQWGTLSNCVATDACTQDDYFDFIMMVAVEQKDDVPNAGLIANVITVNRYWGNAERIIEFSKALSQANDQVEELQLKTVRNKWQEAVYCDGKCPGYHAIFFDFIKLLLAV